MREIEAEGRKEQMKRKRGKETESEKKEFIKCCRNRDKSDFVVRG